MFPAVCGRLTVRWTLTCCYPFRTNFTAPLRNVCISKQRLLDVRSSHVGTSCTSSGVSLSCQRKNVQDFSLIKYYTTSTEEPNNGDKKEDTSSEEEGHSIDSLSKSSESTENTSVESSLDQSEHDSSSDVTSGVSVPSDDNDTQTSKSGGPSQQTWVEDDGIVIYTDQEFLTKRQQKNRQRDVPHSDEAATSTGQDQFNLRSLLQNIQRQQDEQKEKEQRAPRTAMMSVEELVEFLRKDNAKDVCVIAVPPEMDYVEYFVVCSGMGSRHIGRMADHLAVELKRVKVGPNKRRIRVEGRACHDWMAVDLGSMVVHFMLEARREEMELEKLWALGEMYDDHCRSMARNYQEGLAMEQK